MSQLVRLEGKHSTQNAHCAVETKLARLGEVEGVVVLAGASGCDGWDEMGLVIIGDRYSKSTFGANNLEIFLFPSVSVLKLDKTISSNKSTSVSD